MHPGLTWDELNACIDDALRMGRSGKPSAALQKAPGKSRSQRGQSMAVVPPSASATSMGEGTFLGSPVPPPGKQGSASAATAAAFVAAAAAGAGGAQREESADPAAVSVSAKEGEEGDAAANTAAATDGGGMASPPGTPHHAARGAAAAAGVGAVGEGGAVLLLTPPPLASLGAEASAGAALPLSAVVEGAEVTPAGGGEEEQPSQAQAQAEGEEEYGLFLEDGHQTQAWLAGGRSPTLSVEQLGPAGSTSSLDARLLHAASASAAAVAGGGGEGLGTAEGGALSLDEAFPNTVEGAEREERERAGSSGLGGSFSGSGRPGSQTLMTAAVVAAAGVIGGMMLLTKQR